MKSEEDTELAQAPKGFPDPDISDIRLSFPS
jgi:hypothetical protein